jgi:hypothetical protein
MTDTADMSSEVTGREDDRTAWSSGALGAE